MSDSSFKVKNTLIVNNTIAANSSGIFFSNTLAMNSSTFTGTANNSTYLDGYLGTSFIMANGQTTFTNNITHTANLVLGSGAALIAGAAPGTNGQVLTSNGAVPLWGTLANSAYIDTTKANNITGLVNSATTDTTNATNISSGTLNISRLPVLAASATTDTTNATNISSGTLNVARVGSGYPASSVGSGYPASNVTGLAASATTDTTNATNISSGTLNISRVATGYPASNVSGLATSATTDTTNATNISSGTLAQARLINVLFTNTYSQSITGGAVVTPAALANGNFTANSGLCPLQYITNNGAFTITAPSNDGSLVLLVTNSGSASTVSFSGFSVGTNTGDTLDTTNGHMFMIFIVRIHAYSTYSIKSLQ